LISSIFGGATETIRSELTRESIRPCLPWIANSTDNPLSTFLDILIVAANGVFHFQGLLSAR
jgi:hypothetical protein